MCRKVNEMTEFELKQQLAESKRYLEYWCDLWNTIEEWIQNAPDEFDKGNMLYEHSKQIVKGIEPNIKL